VAEWVIDTNILIVATTAQLGHPPEIMLRKGNKVPVEAAEDLEAVFSWLEAINRDKEALIVLDQPYGLIEEEYSHNIKKHEYGRMVIANKLSQGLYRRVDVEVDNDGIATILHDAAEKNPNIVKDPADRRMVAAAVEAGAPIANACDTDWLDLLADGTLETLGIRVHHVIEKWCRDTWERKRAKP